MILVLHSDLVFILLFPHLVLVVHFPKLANKYGMVVGFSIALLFRALSGEAVLNYEAVLKFPYYKVCIIINWRTHLPINATGSKTFRITKLNFRPSDPPPMALRSILFR